MALPALAEKWGDRRLYRAEHIADILDLLRPHLKIPLAECRMLDMGSGTGAICVPASRHVRSVVAVDTDPALLAMSRTWAEREGRTNITFRRESLLDLAADPFDIVVCSDVIEHLEDQDGVAATFARS